ncbi:MAG TPA: hypothetical protein DET40_14140 [Lentisphaeria bacterium]|nr:MAG: hypothetical protein A2X45_20835 [Lentisphaerae bacterium GWF2_50_93]HCE44678.1 hypothetical protein [Lentisphaeria bacterium]
MVKNNHRAGKYQEPKKEDSSLKQKGLQHFMSSSKIRPSSLLACAYLKMREKDKARAQWRKALELKPDDKLKEQIKAELEDIGKP